MFCTLMAANTHQDLYSRRHKGVYPEARQCPHGGVISNHCVGLIGEG